MIPVAAVFYGSVMFLACLGIFFFWRFRLVMMTGRVQVRKSRYHQIEATVKKLQDEQVSVMLHESGLSISALQYQLARYTLLVTWLISSVVSASMKGGDIATGVIKVFLVFLVTSPTPYVWKYKTPFKRVMDLLTERHKYKKGLELYRAISQLKNLIIVKQNNPPGSLYILEQLNKFTKITQPIFNRMLSFWYLGQYQAAKTYFISAMQTDNAEEIANLFIKLDGLNPIELKNQLVLFQEDFKQKRQTEKLKLNQTRSYVVYAIVALSLLLVLVNFLVVGVLLDMMDSFKQLF